MIEDPQIKIEKDDSTDFLEEVGKLNVYAQTFINDKIEHTKVKIAAESVKAASGLVDGVVLGVLSLIILLFLSVVGGLFLGRLLDDYAFGFLIITVFYILILVLYLLLRRKLIKDPLTKAIIKKLL